MMIRRPQLAVYVDCEQHARFQRVTVSRSMTTSALFCEIVHQVINPAPPDTEMLDAIAKGQRTIDYQTLPLNALLKYHPDAKPLTTVRDSYRANVLEAGQ